MNREQFDCREEGEPMERHTGGCRASLVTDFFPGANIGVSLSGLTLFYFFLFFIFIFYGFQYFRVRRNLLDMVRFYGSCMAMWKFAFSVPVNFILPLQFRFFCSILPFFNFSIFHFRFPIFFSFLGGMNWIPEDYINAAFAAT